MQRPRVFRKDSDIPTPWTVADSIELYGIHRWSKGIFTVNDLGHVCLAGDERVNPVDLKSLVDEVRLRGLTPPVLLHFTDILKRRMDLLVSSFEKAMRDHNYSGCYRGVYPIKVNQHRHVLEDIVSVGKQHHFGLECGSKPELLIAIALHDDPEGVIICNGFKDEDFVRTALFGLQLGNRIFLVVEKLAELALVIKAARAMRVQPLIGLRMKLASRGKGLWETSGGEHSKFGLRAEEMVEALRMLKRKHMLGCLQLLHWHLGSQISDIQCIKEALKEACSFYSEIVRMGAPIRYVDAGGGVAVDYDGSHTNFASSANYTLDEYAADVVSALAGKCEEAGIEHPTIITEAGRALVAHHSVLVVETMSCSQVPPSNELPPVTGRTPEVVKRLREVLEGFTGKNFQETYHDALEARRDALLLFNLGHLSLPSRALAERYFWSVCRRIRDYIRHLEYVPDEISGLERMLSTIYYCNFSLFQSLPDHWAVKQLFPVVPLHRLDTQPTEEGILADITCDSDGMMSQFVDLRDMRDTLPLHPLIPGEPYYIGVFLVGAYQEILGDLHNLFGDTNVVHVSVGPNGYEIDKTVEGDCISDVLGYVEFSGRDLLGLMRKRVEASLRTGSMKLEETAPFIRDITDMLDDYTYCRLDNR